MAVLPDILEENLKLVFCGTAASNKSAQIGAYYAGPGNRFWPTLHEIGLTPHQFSPPEFRKLLDYRIGLTDVAKHAQGMDSALKSNDFDREVLRAKLVRYQPGVIAFTSKRAAREFFGMKANQKLDYGFHADVVGKTRVYVLPSPSGAARVFWDISWWQRLADVIKQGDAT